MDGYQYRALEDGEIRLLTLRPGNLGDEVKVSIAHVTLNRSETRPRPALPSIQARLPEGWHVHEELSKRLCFCHNLGHGKRETHWQHPDAGLEAQDYEDYSHGRFLNPLSFEALSYTWGDPADRESIVVIPEDAGNHCHVEESLSIGRNLAQALRHLRSEDDVRVLWVDAICINQEDDTERSKQVQRASLVYEEARRVVVWLGLSSQDSDVAVSALKELGRQVAVAVDGQILPAPAAEINWRDGPVTVPHDRSVWAAIDSFLNRPWFTRVWILQEVLLSDHALFVCGNKTVTCPELGRALYFLKFQVQLGESLSRGLLNSRIMLVFPTTVATWTISGVVRISHECRCTIDKDAIYGALGLLPESFRSMITPDYTLTTKAVYTDFVTSHIAYTKRLELLHMCGMRQQQRLQGLPSWVPDFYLDPAEPLGLGSWLFCTGHSACDVVVLDDNTLEVTGVLAATVLTVSEEVPNNETDHQKLRSDTIEAVRRIRDAFEWDEPNIRLKEGPDAFMWTVLASFITTRLPEKFTPGAFREELRPMLRASAIFGDGDGNATSQTDPSIVEDFCLRMLMGKRVIKTADGHWGIGPSSTEKGEYPNSSLRSVTWSESLYAHTGDVIACFLGAERPYVLRRSDDQKFTIVGECFLPEVADMRPFLGPLPQPWEVRFFVESMEGAGHYRYVNTETGMLSDHDPRLGPLPEDVEVMPRKQRTGDDPRIFQTYRNRRTGVEENSDPRLTPAALESRGVRLQRFALH